jgi:hypothetical protein
MVCSQEIITIWLNYLVAGCYLASVGERIRYSEEGKRILSLSMSLIDRGKSLIQEALAHADPDS